MAQRKDQKVFYYSTEIIKNILESRISDLAHKEQRTSSYIIEKILMDALLPKHPDARYYIIANFYNGKAHGAVKNTIATFFSYNAAGIGGGARYTNYMPLVKFCVEQCFAESDDKIVGVNSHFINQLRDVAERIEECSKICIEIPDRVMYSKQSKKAKLMMESAVKEKAEINFLEHFELVLDCWPMLKDWSFTYRYLADLASMRKWNESPDARNQLYDALNSISEEWGKE